MDILGHHRHTENNQRLSLEGAAKRKSYLEGLKGRLQVAGVVLLALMALPFVLCFLSLIMVCTLFDPIIWLITGKLFFIRLLEVWWAE